MTSDTPISISLPARLRAALTHGSGHGSILLRGSLQAAIVSGVGVVLSFGTQLILARSLGADDYGTYAVVLSWLNVLQIFATLGLENAAVRFASTYARGGDWASVQAYSRFAVRCVLLSSVTLTALGGGVLLLRQGLAPGLRLPLVTLVILLPCYAILAVQSAILQGSGNIIGAQAPNAVARPLIFVALVLSAMVYAGHRLPPTEVLLLNGTAGIVVVLVSGWLIHRHAGGVVASSTEEQRREWLRVSLALLTMSILQMGASQQLGIFIVGLLRTPREAGIYSAATQLSLPLLLGIQAVQFVAAPMMADLHARQRIPELQRVVTLAFLGSAAFAIPCFLGIVVFGRWALGLYGPAFVAGYPILLVLSATAVVVALGGGIGSWLLSVTGNERVGIQIVAMAATCNLVMSVVLVHKFGTLGAAAAAGLAVLLRFVLVASYTRRRMGIKLLPIGPAIAWARETLNSRQ